MSWLRFLYRNRADSELQQEIEEYLCEEIADNLARGMPRLEAERRARIKLGNRQRVREELWQQNTIGMIETVWRDLKYAARTLRRTPGFTAIAILVMALGIGASVALFAVVGGVLLRPLPFRDQDRLLMIYERGIGGDVQRDLFNVVSGAMYAEWRKQNRSFSDLVLVGSGESNLSGDGGQLPEKVPSAQCTWNLLRTLGVKPALGRDLTAFDDRPSANATVLLGWSLWKRRFGGDAGIVNQTIHLDGKPSYFYSSASRCSWLPVLRALCRHGEPHGSIPCRHCAQTDVLRRLTQGGEKPKTDAPYHRAGYERGNTG